MSIARQDLEIIVDEVVRKFYLNDSELLTKGLEWAISHRLAVYLESYFSGWNVDCEYTKTGSGHDSKRDSNNNRRRPDIVIHKRGLIEKANNLLIIEVKFENDDISDFDKLVDFTSKPKEPRKFQYQYGLAISFSPKLKLHWFENGKYISRD